MRAPCILAAVLALPTAALADSKSDAQHHFERALQLHKQGEFANARDELELAYALDPRPELLYALGQVYAKLDKCDRAVDYYNQFIAAKPDPDAAAAANEAIAACNARPSPAPEPAPTPPPQAPPPQDHPTHHWYSDTLGVALVGTGVAAGVGSLLFYTSARGKISDAETTAAYDAHLQLIDDAHSFRTYSIVLGIGSAALIGFGVFHLVSHGKAEPSSVAIVPSATGGSIAWAGQF